MAVTPQHPMGRSKDFIECLCIRTWHLHVDRLVTGGGSQAACAEPPDRLVSGENQGGLFKRKPAFYNCK